MKCYVIRMGFNFESEKDAHGNNFFSTIEQAVDWGKLNLLPGQKFWVCDENGGVLVISQVPQIVGNA
jgi:hypothetical protein